MYKIQKVIKIYPYITDYYRPCGPCAGMKGGVMVMTKQDAIKKAIIGVIIENKVYCIDCCNPDEAQYIIFKGDSDRKTLRCSRCERMLSDRR
jgi:hypothetical protein